MTTPSENTNPLTYGSGTDKYTVAAAVAHAISGQPLDFENATKHILASKIQDAVDIKRTEVAAQVFGAPKAAEEAEEAEEVETPSEEIEPQAEDEDEKPSEE